MEHVIRRRVRVTSSGQIQLRAEELRGVGEAEVIVIVENKKAKSVARRTLFDSIADYASLHAGTDEDLDLELEAASLELWRNESKAKQL